MNSDPDAIVEVVSAERRRCAKIAADYANMFERKRLYNTARAMREIAEAIRAAGNVATGFPEGSGAIPNPQTGSRQ